MTQISGETGKTWTETTNSDGDKIITDGEVEVKIGDYVNYDATAGVSEENSSYTSLSSSNGYGDQEFTVSSYTRRLESIQSRKWTNIVNTSGHNKNK